MFNSFVGGDALGDPPVLSEYGAMVRELPRLLLNAFGSQSCALVANTWWRTNECHVAWVRSTG